ncbi:MAG: glycosyltransferase family 4 protein [Clostridia bacterium]|jgi:glycosyltransferase involved in cell wall biosynthesis|nr:glycosyltransferase family 4 protein [Clostridia bacterium]
MKIMILAGDARTLLYFREEMILAMLDKGHEVIAAAPQPIGEWAGKFSFQRKGFKCLSLPQIDKTGTNPFKDILGFFSIMRVLQREKPDKIFTYQAKTIIYGTLAAWFLGIEEVYILMGGLGSILRNEKKSMIKKILQLQYKLAFKKCKKVFFQNADDYNLMLQEGLVETERVQMVKGSGVNMDKFTYTPIQDFPVFLFVGRLIRDKGVLEYIAAAKLVKKRYPEAKFQIVGYFDTNPTALSPEEFHSCLDDGLIEYLGEAADVRPFLAKSSVFVLPSYHEGIPKSVLEAMAMGRPIITTDAPGCKDTVIDGVNGFLVPVKNSEKLAEKMIWMIENKDKAMKMGQASVRICQENFEVSKVNEVLLKTMNL